MNKIEFLNILKQTLIGEVSNEVIEQNISYYDTYIGSGSEEEEARVISELGDPRLIAKTIIEAERVAKEKNRGSWNQSTYQEHQTDTDYNQPEDNQEFGRTRFFSNFKWYHKLIAALIVIIIFALILLIGRIIIGFLFAFGLPLILLILIMTLFRKR